MTEFLCKIFIFDVIFLNLKIIENSNRGLGINSGSLVSFTEPKSFTLLLFCRIADETTNKKFNEHADSFGKKLCYFLRFVLWSRRK